MHKLTELDHQLEQPGLSAWLLSALTKIADVQAANVRLEAMSGDASFRRYYRVAIVHNGDDKPDIKSSYILAIAPPATEKNQEFVAISALLASQNIAASEVLAFDLETGWLLQHDAGDQLLSNIALSPQHQHYYDQALQQLLAFAQIPQADLTILGHYDAAALQCELDIFTEWFVAGLLQLELDREQQALLQRFFQRLIDRACQQSQVFVHRDYHCRNIMLDGDALVAIDFQDALKGPITYDAVSLWKDCYLRLPKPEVLAYLEQFYRQLQNQQLIADTLSFTDFQQDFDWMGLQRHIKVLGVFARLSQRDAKHGYLQDLPLVVDYIRDALSAYSDPALRHFADWFETQLMPLIRQQSWWRDLSLAEQSEAAS